MLGSFLDSQGLKRGADVEGISLTSVTVRDLGAPPILHVQRQRPSWVGGR